jgi:hypothetical protein
MKEYVEINPVTFPTPYTMSLNDYRNGWNACLNFVLQHKVTDVAPVVHGRWLEAFRSQRNPDGYFYWNTPQKKIYVCSICGREEVKKEPYCNCGAKMDGGNK